MARTGDVIETPAGRGLTGRAVLRKTAADTDGELVRMDFTCPAGVPLSIAHIHPKQEERFEVLSGTFGFNVDGEEQAGGAGHELAVPPGVRHNFWNAGDTEGDLRMEFRPALSTETIFETLWGLAQDGKVNEKTHMPNMLQLAVTFSKYDDAFVPTSPPRAVQKALFAVLAPIGRLLGYRARSIRTRMPGWERAPVPRSRRARIRP